MAPLQKVRRSEAEWKRRLSPEQFQVTRKKATERAFTGQYYASSEKGIYRCVCCATPLFSSKTKFMTLTGWPSFYAPIRQEHVALVEDNSYGMRRTEVVCAVCDAHLGHVFNDGPRPTGLRYCINSLALNFSKESPDRLSQALEQWFASLGD